MHSVEPVYGWPYTVHCRWDRSFLSEDLREAEKLYRDFLRGDSLLTLVERRNCNACRRFFFLFPFFILRNLSFIIFMGLNSPKPKKRGLLQDVFHILFSIMKLDFCYTASAVLTQKILTSGQFDVLEP